ncbi:MAG: prealbumin-like fold domain-containing protein [Oscillospiraceae bacterium]|nr:prealbumin-like fold domain-containing protein [Oscillospiraceae bacterium]
MPSNVNAEKATIKIHDAAELAAVKSNAEYELAGDIALGGRWHTLEGISNISFYGNGHQIKNMTAPLFGHLVQSKIMHLRVEARVTRQTERYTGALLRTGIRVTLSGCSVNGTVDGAEYVGGLAGDLSQSTLTNCASVAAISGEQYVGGLVGCVSHSSVTENTNSGQLKAVSRAMYAGGVVGYAQDQSYIADNVNTGPLVGFGFHCLGGIAGGVRDVRVFSGNVNKGMIQGRRFTGGIAGMADSSALERNHNLGPVTCALDNVGGIVGYAFKPPVLIRGNTSAGAVEGQADFTGGICGFAGEGSAIIDNTVSCPTIKGMGSVGRILGGGEALLSNTRVNGQCVVIGPTPPLMYFKESIVTVDNPEYGVNGRHGESFICPEGMTATGIWMLCVPKSAVEISGNEMEAQSNVITPKGQTDDVQPVQGQTVSQVEAGIAVLSRSFEQIVTSLGLGVTALSRVFQTDVEMLQPMLARDRDTLRTLRLLQSTLNAYMEYCDNVDPGDDLDYVSAPAQADPTALLTAKVERVVLKLSAETTQTPLEGVPVTAAYEGFSKTFYSDAEGQAIIEGLPMGTYDVKEDAAPALYLRDSDVHRLIVQDDGEYVWEGRLGLHWGDLIMVTIPHKRDDSALFLHGEIWAAHPEKPAAEASIPPRMPSKPSAAPKYIKTVNQQGRIVDAPRFADTANLLEPDAYAKAAAREVIESVLGAGAQPGAGDPCDPVETNKTNGAIKAIEQSRGRVTHAVGTAKDIVDDGADMATLSLNEGREMQ